MQAECIQRFKWWKKHIGKIKREPCAENNWELKIFLLFAVSDIALLFIICKNYGCFKFKIYQHFYWIEMVVQLGGFLKWLLLIAYAVFFSLWEKWRALIFEVELDEPYSVFCFTLLRFYDEEHENLHVNDAFRIWTFNEVNDGCAWVAKCKAYGLEIIPLLWKNVLNGFCD